MSRLHGERFMHARPSGHRALVRARSMAVRLLRAGKWQAGCSSRRGSTSRSQQEWPTSSLDLAQPSGFADAENDCETWLFLVFYACLAKNFLRLRRAFKGFPTDTVPGQPKSAPHSGRSSLSGLRGGAHPRSPQRPSLSSCRQGPTVWSQGETHDSCLYLFDGKL